MSETLNLVDLIENNPVTKLSKVYNGKLLSRIKATFTDSEQQLFVAGFYCSLNYNKRTDFMIDLDNVWKWLGFSTKQKAKLLLEKTFVANQDYQLLLNQQVKQANHVKGGHNKEIIMMNIETFKRFCLKAGTKKANEIHEYYIKLEETLHDVIQEESDELKFQLENRTNELVKLTEQSELEKIKLREKTILEQFTPNTQCVYYGFIDNVSSANEPLIKFGNSNNLRNRVLQHKDTYNNFRLVNAFKVNNKLEIETAIKTHDVFSPRIRSLMIKTRNYVELLNIDGLSCHAIDRMIQEIIKSIECTPENYKRLNEENALLRKQLYEKGQSDNSNHVTELRMENERLTRNNTFLLKRNKKLERTTTSLKSFVTRVTTQDNIEIDEGKEEVAIQPVQSIPIDNIRVFKRPTKQKDGRYYIDNQIYDICSGTRQEVWDGKAYKTTGGLFKSDLVINKEGKIVSLRKSISEKIDNRLENVNLKRMQR
jgi:phage anti-repressor protein